MEHIIWLKKENRMITVKNICDDGGIDIYCGSTFSQYEPGYYTHVCAADFVEMQCTGIEADETEYFVGSKEEKMLYDGDMVEIIYGDTITKASIKYKYGDFYLLFGAPNGFGCDQLIHEFKSMQDKSVKLRRMWRVL